MDGSTSMTTDYDSTSQPLPAEHRPVDEHANLITHGLGLLLSVTASAVLISVALRNPQSINLAACTIYCGSLVSLYAASTLSHTFHDLAWRRLFRTVDQACIYLLIAGSFTPFAVKYLRHGWWPNLLTIMWGLAVFGVLLVLFMRNLTPAAKITYGLLGWLPAISLKTLIDVAPTEVIVWIIAGGFFYSAGAVFLRFDQHVRYFHALWHTFVVAGSICHYIAILLSVA